MREYKKKASLELCAVLFVSIMIVFVSSLLPMQMYADSSVLEAEDNQEQEQVIENRCAAVYANSSVYAKNCPIQSYYDYENGICTEVVLPGELVFDPRIDMETQEYVSTMYYENGILLNPAN
ncbi:MAG: hypothetical protein LBU61_01400 [Coriobacteriales bacterium]|jgi:hypothetical protein|nr:hypothetical protein [Coriobacteriales bacterium]